MPATIKRNVYHNPVLQPHPKQTRALMILRCITLFILCQSFAYAEGSGTVQTKETLQQILNEINRNEQLNQQKRAEMKKTAEEISCNWRQIRSYEICAQLYQDKPQEEKECIQKAKSNATHCITDKHE